VYNMGENDLRNISIEVDPSVSAQAKKTTE